MYIIYFLFYFLIAWTNVPELCTAHIQSDYYFLLFYYSHLYEPESLDLNPHL
jgi:hypothetical protein